MSLLKENNCGRSMVEMLGVLALIAVLTVGGIEGFGKAMQMWKSNVQKQTVASLISSVIEIRGVLGSSESSGNLTYIVEAMGGVPEGTTYQSNLIYDKNGVNYSVWYRKDTDYVIEIYFSASDGSFDLTAKDLCYNVMLASQATAAEIIYVDFTQKTGTTRLYTGAEAMATTTVSEIHQKCSRSVDEASSATRFSIHLALE